MLYSPVIFLCVLLVVLWLFRRHIRLEIGPLRHLVIFFGVLTLMAGFGLKGSARQPHEETVAIAVVQLGGVLVAIGMATSDIVQAIKRGPDRPSEQLPQSGQSASSTARE